MQQVLRFVSYKGRELTDIVEVPDKRTQAGKLPANLQFFFDTFTSQLRDGNIDKLEIETTTWED